ncbi:MAG: hypothetical protein K5668_08450 [Lachnospiraceae bacterium]|nr:hypothetical protein [Lachnospiraceae bacterium]
MLRKRRLSSGDLMLLELVFAIIFFCLTMAGTMSVFGNAYEMSTVAEDRDLATRETATAAEIIRASGSRTEMDGLLQSNGFTPAGENVYEKTYGDGKYRLTISVSMPETMLNADMACYYTKSTASHSSDEAFYDLNIRHSMKGGDSDG